MTCVPSAPLSPGLLRPIVIAIVAALSIGSIATAAPAATGTNRCNKSAKSYSPKRCAEQRRIAKAHAAAKRRALAKRHAAAKRRALVKKRAAAKKRVADKKRTPKPIAVLAPLPTVVVPPPTPNPPTTTASPTTPTAPPTTPPAPPTTTTPPTTPPTSTPSTAPLYWGAWIGSHITGTEAPWDLNAISTFEQHAGKEVSLVHFSSPFGNCYDNPCSKFNFPGGEFTKIRNIGAIPVFSWASNTMPTEGDQSDYQLSDVIAGKHDTYIRAWATAAKSWGHPFFLRFNWEMNGNWFSWSEGVNGNQRGEYVAAWRHVHDIFTSVGAKNATWTWCPNIDPNHLFGDLRSLYPGDDYVDWTCLDGYNWNDPWTSFADLYRSTYQEITTSIAPSKPMMVGEVASTESGGSKAAWITAMFASLETDFPKVRALQWFDKIDGGMDWPIETSTSATAAFKAGIGSPRYRASAAGITDGLTLVAPPAP